MECLGPNMFANSESYNYFSSNSKVSFDGFINENYFHIYPETSLIQNLEITHAITKNPITYLKEAFLGIFLKSKYDGKGNRHPLNMSIALDVSGSIGNIEEDGKERITLAKESLKKLVSIMDQENDKMSLITFNHDTQKIFGLLDKKEIENKFLSDIDAIRADGGTDLVGALQSAMDNIETNDNNKYQRIIMITDVEYCDDNDKLFDLFKKCVEEKKISITIIAISRNSNLSLADKVSHFKGCNYFPITKTSELETFMIKNFNYIFFPIAHETKLTIKSEKVQIIKCVGGSNELPDEYENNKEDIVKPSKEVKFEFGSAFSSELLNKDGNFYTKGGLILLKINIDNLNKNDDFIFDIIFEYESFDGKKCCQNYSYTIDNKEKEKNNFFKNNNIQKGISIYYFCVMLNHIVEVENVENNRYFEYSRTERDELKKKKYLKLLETRQALIDYLNNNYVIEPDIKEMRSNLDNYKKLIEDQYSEFKDAFCNGYHYIYKFINN